VRSRAALRSSLGWAFGMAVSILFLALWGRAVVADTETLSDSLSPLARSGIVADFVADWMAEELTESGADPATVRPTVDYFFESSSVGDTVDQLVGEVVYAAAASSPEGSRIDMAALIGPTVPELTAGLSGMGYPVAESQVADVVAGLDPLVIRQPGADAIVGPNSPTAARLGTAALLAVLGIVVFGLGVVSLSEDRIGAVRALATRVAVGGLSFAVFLRLGSWVLDPSGGRAPVRSTLSELAGSKWMVPLQVAVVAGAIAGAIYVGRRWLRRRGVSLWPPAPPTQPREREQSRSGSS
jgi:hypothetical protein